MEEETKVEQAVVDTTTNTGVGAEERTDAASGAEIDDLREAMKKSDWVARLVSGDKKEEAKAADDGKAKDATAQTTEKKQDEQQEKTEDKAAETKVADEKPKKKVKREEPPRPEVDVGSVAEAAAEAAARTVSKMQSDKAVEEIPEHIKKREDVYKELEQLDPKKYSGIMRKLADFAKREEDRADAWERAHHGEAYDADAEEHKGWYESNEPKIDPDDLEEAKISAKANKIIEQRLKPEIEKTRVEVEKTRVEPLATAAAANVTEKVLGAFVENAELSREVVKKLIDEDPDAYEIAVQVDNAFRPVAAAVPKLYRGIEEFDEKNQAHVAARGMLTQMETELAQSEADQLVRGGKQWVPLSKFYSIPVDKRRGYWCVSEADIANYVALTAQQEAKKAYETHQKKLEAYAKRRGWVKQDAANAQQNGSSTQKVEQQKPSTPAPTVKSPSVGSSPAVGAKTGNAEQVSNDPLSPLWTRMGLPA